MQIIFFIFFLKSYLKELYLTKKMTKYEWLYPGG